MITQVGAVDLAANIAAIEVLGGALKNISKEYYTILGTRYSACGSIQNAKDAVMVWNYGTEEEKVLVEKVILVIGGPTSTILFPEDDASDWAADQYFDSLNSDITHSDVVRTYKTNETGPGVGRFGFFNFPAMGVYTLDWGGIILPNGHGLGVSSSLEVTVNANFIIRVLP